MKASHMIDWGKTAAEIQDDYAAVCQQRDDCIATLERIAKGAGGCYSEWAAQAIAKAKESR